MGDGNIEPRVGGYVVLWNTVAVAVEKTEVMARSRVTPLCSLLKPPMLLPFLILLLLPTLALAVPSKHVLIGNVVKVTDGDTITILKADNEQDRIRLWGIDAPVPRKDWPRIPESRG